MTKRKMGTFKVGVPSRVDNMEDVITFGFYKGKTFQYVYKKSPGYIIWMHEKLGVKFPKEILQDAKERDFEDSREFSRSWGAGQDPTGGYGSMSFVDEMFGYYDGGFGDM